MFSLDLEAKRLISILRNIDQYPEDLKFNWDSYGGHPPSPESMEAAKVFVCQCFLLSIPGPFISPHPHGFMAFESQLKDREDDAIIGDIKNLQETSTWFEPEGEDEIELSVNELVQKLLVYKDELH